MAVWLRGRVGVCVDAEAATSGCQWQRSPHPGWGQQGHLGTLTEFPGNRTILGCETLE